MKRVIVVGGSAGGISAFCSLLKGIPGNFPAPILAVLHIAEETHKLSMVLQRCSALKVVDPTKPEPIQPGKVYLAPPNRHLVVRSGCATAVMGPRENRHRPSVDTLFRSAARSYRTALIGVVLTGALDDGSAGALAIKSRGGTLVVQDPDDAEVPDMPANVIRQVKADHCVKLTQIPAVLQRLVSKNGKKDLPKLTSGDCEAGGTEPVSSLNEPFALTCPECDGALLPVKDGKVKQWHCHVGHRFTLSSFTEAHADAVERAVWVALRKLRERQVINDQLSRDSVNSPQMRKRFGENAAAAAHDIKLLEEVLARL